MRRIALMCASVVAVGVLTLGASSLAGAQYPPPPSGGGSGSAGVGGSVSGTATGFAPGTTVNYPGGSGTADASGNLSFTINVSDPHYSINGGTLQTANYGANTINFTGTAPGGGPNTYTYILTIAGASTTGTSSSSTTATNSTGGLAFTGADIGLTVGGGVLLIAIGTIVLVATNRRRSSKHA